MGLLSFWLASVLLVVMLRLLARQIEPVMAKWRLSLVFQDPSGDSHCTPAIAFLNLSLASLEPEQLPNARLLGAVLCRGQIDIAFEATTAPTEQR